MGNTVAPGAVQAAKNPLNMNMYHASEMRLYSLSGKRLYLNKSERKAFERKARKQPLPVRSFCLCLLYTGCRLTEARNLRTRDVQAREGTIAINSLKKRNVVWVREMPVPVPVMREISTVTNVDGLIWPISRSTAWRWVKHVMQEAKIEGHHASPKGLRHSFGIHAVMNNVPLSVLRKWLGHSHIETTSIYAQAVGPEERELAKRMWN